MYKLLTLFINIYGIFAKDKVAYIALTQPKSKVLYNKLLDISNPISENYGNWLSKYDINDLIYTIHDIEGNHKVLKWLRDENIHKIHNYNDAIKIIDSTVKINKLFNITDITNSYQVPIYLSKYIDFVEMSRMSDIYKTKKINIIGNMETVDDRYFGRESMLNLYNISNNTIGKSVSGGVIEYQDNDGFKKLDLNTQQISNNQGINNIKHIIGNNKGENIESELDVQVLSQSADNIDLWYWQSPYWLYSMSVDFYNANTIPHVISMSWGWAEDRQCDIIDCNNVTSAEYIDRVNYEYTKILLRGTTIVASSGDAGAPGRTSEGCVSNRPVNAVFPGSSEFVISVGATFVETKNTSDNSRTPLCSNHSCVEGNIEHITNFDNVSWTSGGGFSNYTNSSYWQKKVIDDYLEITPSLPNSSTFNSNGRAYPDISLVGHSCPTYIGGTLQKIDGTSCSSPLMAGLIAVINKHQLSKNKSIVGYFNPLLYHIFENCDNCFNDITSGNNWCTEQMCCNSQYGYRATVGYDPVSGMGTPNIGNILHYLDTM